MCKILCSQTEAVPYWLHNKHLWWLQGIKLFQKGCGKNYTA